MNIFVISLQRSIARRDAVAAQFAKLRQRFEFFDAIDGNAAATRHFLRFDRSTFRLNTYRDPATGEIACYASHLQLWKHAANTNEPILILEDDCRLADTFPAAVAATSRLIDRFGFIRLQYSLRRRRFRFGATAHLIQPIDDFDLYYLSRVPLCLTGYALSPRTAAQLVASSLTLTAPVDKFLQRTWEHRVPIFGLEPACVSVSSLGLTSTIGNRSVKQRTPGAMLRRGRYKLQGSLARSRFNKTQLELLNAPEAPDLAVPYSA